MEGIVSTPSITTYPSWVLWMDIFDLLVVAYARVGATRLLSFVVAFLIMWKCTVIMYMHGYGGYCFNTIDYYLPKLGIMNGYLRFIGCSICYGRCNSFVVLRCGIFDNVEMYTNYVHAWLWRELHQYHRLLPTLAGYYEWISSICWL